ncbi:hypothetical protein T484DRAFT_1614120, partial [Baffinella frigidus]
GSRVQGPGFRGLGSGSRVQGPGFRIQGIGFRVQGSGSRVQGPGSRVQGAGCWVQGSLQHLMRVVLHDRVKLLAFGFWFSGATGIMQGVAFSSRQAFKLNARNAYVWRQKLPEVANLATSGRICRQKYCISSI